MSTLDIGMEGIYERAKPIPLLEIDNIHVAADFRVLSAALSQNNTLNTMNSTASKYLID